MGKREGGRKEAKKEGGRNGPGAGPWVLCLAGMGVARLPVQVVAAEQQVSCWGLRDIL